MKLKMRNKVTPEFTMAAMTDFVFQLLIIFMLISTLATESQSNVMDVNLPKSTTTSEKAPSVVVAVNAKLEYFVNGKPVAKEGIVDALKPLMVGTKPPTVQLAIDETAPHKVFVELVDEISVKNKWKIGILTRNTK